MCFHTEVPILSLSNQQAGKFGKFGCGIINMAHIFRLLNINGVYSELFSLQVSRKRDVKATELTNYVNPEKIKIF